MITYISSLFIYFYHERSQTLIQARALYHNGDVADALEAVVHSSIRHLHQHFLDRFAVVFWVHRLGGAKFLGDFEFLRVDVHADDPGGSGNFTAHDSGETDSS